MKSFMALPVLLFSSVCAQAILPDMNEPVLPMDVNTPPNAELTNIPLPPKDSVEYWVLRSDAVQEFIPLLTRKRSEIRTRAKRLTGYLLQIGKASQFAEHDILVPYDAKVYADILRTDPGLQKINAEPPKESPTWDQLVEIAMQHVLSQGYLPTDVEDDEKQQYIAACKKKEEYGQKVRADLHRIMDQCAGMWVYLDQIGRLGDFKAYEADVALRQDAEYEAERKTALQQKRFASMQRAEDKRQREYEQRMARREFSSSLRELDYYYRQQQLLYRQSLLDQRFINCPYCY